MEYKLAVGLVKSGQSLVGLNGSTPIIVSADPTLDEVVSATSTGGSPQIINFPFPSAGLKLIYFISDRNVTITFKSGTPSTVGTLVLKAGVAGYWVTGMTALVSGDVVTMSLVYDTNTLSTNGRIQGVVGYDATP